MNDMTLREVCENTGVSRRAVQGYEKAGLVTATGKNYRGHLLYDESSQERIQRIKLFQELGFSIKEIKEIIDAPNQILKAALEERIEGLRSESRNMEINISKARELIATL